MKHFLYHTALVAALAVSGGAFAQDPNAYYRPYGASPAREIPTIDTSRDYKQGTDVNFVTGGIGDDERQAIEATKSSYNVHVTNASTDGAFVENTQVTIRNKAGQELLSVDAGPLLYVQLAPGSYMLEATHNNETRKKSIVIGKKSKGANINLGWRVPATIAGETN